MGSTINPYGKEIVKVEGEYCGRPISLETGRLAFQADGVVTVRYGDTVVMGIATVSDKVDPDIDYFPLSIDYEEKMYATGKISGSRFIKREGRPSEEAILTGRLIDRPIRPLFPKGYRNQIQGIAHVLSVDPELKPDGPAMIAVSAALMLTGIPFDGPVAGVRIGKVDGELIAFPTREQIEKSDLDLTVAGTKEAIMMVEAGANEISEVEMIEAIEMAHKSIQPVLELQSQLIEKVGVTAREYEEILPSEEIQSQVDDFLKGKMGATVRGTHQDGREEAVSELRKQAMEALVKDEELSDEYSVAFASAMKKEIRRAILEEGIRPDNRGPEDIRPLSSEVGVLPRTHGSSIFTRGATQALNVTTLAPLSYGQIIDTMEQDTEKHFIHHYNMPGYTVGEIRRLGGPGRREIGHGHLAQRALEPMIPSIEDFPYTIRTVSELMSSNGSTSMASVCSGCLSLMDAGVPLKRPVSGIAMGLMTSDDHEPVILSDIQGIEDFAGDMDFKVTGTTQGITALQMDIKVHGLTKEVMTKALEQAKRGRAIILDHMLTTLPEPRKQISQYAPQVETIMINPEKIGAVIGKGGETINKIIAETGAEIDIRDEGQVLISAPDKTSIEAAKQWVQMITAEPEIGKIYDSKVVKIMEFGVFVEIMPGHEGLVHVSEMAYERVNHPSDLVKEGDKVTVKLVAIDDKGRLVLSMKQASKTDNKDEQSKNDTSK